MLESDYTAHTPSGVYSSLSDSDSIKGASSLVSGKITSSSHVFKDSNADSHVNEFCANDAIIGDKTPEFNDSSADPLGNITHADSNLNFLENTEVKDSSDFLYYSWPEIENFEDVDRMFRSCDSTFGLGASSEAESGCFLSSDNIGGTGEIVNSDYKFSCLESNSVENLSTNHDSLKSQSSNDADMMSVPVRLRDSPQVSEKLGSYESFMKGPTMANVEEEFIPKAQMNGHQKMVKLQNDSHKAFSSMCKQQPQHVLDPGSCIYLQNHLSYVHPDNSPLSGLTSVNLTSAGVKMETNELTSPSARDSSHASNLFPSTDGCHDPSLHVAARKGIGKREKSHNYHGNLSPVENSIKPTKNKIMVQAASSNTASMAEEAHYAGGKSEMDKDIEEVRHFISAELGSSNIQESTSSGMDDISLEAASFRQLQIVMEQLDLKTKICIRDSLYRLARSAEQRHNNHANLNSSCGDGRDASGSLITEGQKNFMDIETDTNPVDRSVAHLLFHRPSESSSASAHDSLPFKSPITVQGCGASKVATKNMIDGEETGPDTNACSDTAQ